MGHPSVWGWGRLPVGEAGMGPPTRPWGGRGRVRRVEEWKGREGWDFGGWDRGRGNTLKEIGTRLGISQTILKQLGTGLQIQEPGTGLQRSQAPACRFARTYYEGAW